MLFPSLRSSRPSLLVHFSPESSTTELARRMSQHSPLPDQKSNSVVENQVHPPSVLGTAANRELFGPRDWNDAPFRECDEPPLLTAKFKLLRERNFEGNNRRRTELRHPLQSIVLEPPVTESAIKPGSTPYSTSSTSMTAERRTERRCF